MNILSLLSVWTGLVAAVMAAIMLVRRSLLGEIWFTIAIYAAIFALTFAGMALWGLRKEYSRDESVVGQRSQCYVGIGLAGIALAIAYGLFFRTVQ